MKKGEAKGQFEIYIDGSSRGNPGQAGCVVVIRDGSGTILLEQGYPLGVMTNNAAEYNALIIALEEALVLGAKAVKVYADSELLVRQINGQYRVKNADLKVLHGRASRLAKGFVEFEIEHVMREKNKEADKLAQKASQDGKKAEGAKTKGKVFGPREKIDESLF